MYKLGLGPNLITGSCEIPIVSIYEHGRFRIPYGIVAVVNRISKRKLVFPGFKLVSPTKSTPINKSS